MDVPEFRLEVKAILLCCRITSQINKKNSHTFISKPISEEPEYHPVCPAAEGLDDDADDDEDETLGVLF